jgi:hypothetical protein
VDERDSILVRLLAQVDSAFLPARKWHTHQPQNAYQFRVEYFASGVPWRTDAGGEAERKRAQRDLDALIADGLLTRASGEARTLAVRLSDLGERRARALVCLAGLSESWALLADVAGRCKRRPRLLLDAWVSELALAGMGNYPKPWTTDAETALGMLGLRALPLLLRGLLATASDTHGRAFYGLTARGLAALDSDVRPEPDPEPALDDGASELYRATMRATIARLRTAEPPAVQEIAPLPFPASPAGLAFSATWGPFGHDEAAPAPKPQRRQRGERAGADDHGTK